MTSKEKGFPTSGAPAKDEEHNDRRAADLMDAAARLPETERVTFLTQACGDDASLTRDIRDLLEAAGKGLHPFRAGDFIAGRFRVIREIAEGGMGVVYEAFDEKLLITRALKCAKSGHGSSLPPEARNALRVTHPNVCRVFEIHSTETRDGPIDFLNMELIEGGTLASHLKSHGKLPEAEARDIALQICAGVEAAHAEGLLHRDLKSQNVLLAQYADGKTRAVVTDFGLAQDRSAAGSGGTAGRIAGTPEYMAPECWRGEPASIASDIYALGIVLHELIAGHRPKLAEGADPSSARVPQREVPARWRKIIGRCLHPDPARRYQSAAEVAEVLEGKSHRRWLGVAAAFLFAILTATAAMWLSVPASPPPARLAVLPIEVRDADASTKALVQGASYDLSSRLSRLRPRPTNLVVIPVEQTSALAGADVTQIKGRVGATHVLQATLTQAGTRLVLRGSLVDTTTKVALRESTAEYSLTDGAALTSALVAMVAEVFKLPRQTKPESVSPAAYASYAQGMSLLRGGSLAYSQAIEEFEKASALDPKSALPEAGLAEACYKVWQSTGDPKWLARGREELVKAEIADPDSLAVRLASGKLNLASGEYNRAVQDFQRAIQLDPSGPEAFAGLALTYQSMPGRDNDAVAAYLKAIELQPGYFAPLLELGNLYRSRGNYQEAERDLQKVIELTPQLLAGHVNLGGLYGDMGRWDDAERELKQALQIDERSRPVLNNLGATYVYQGRDQEALQYFERARTIGPETDVLLLNIGESNRRIGRLHQASDAYRRGRELAQRNLLSNPSDGATRALVAYFAARLRDRSSAEREIVQALHFGGQQKTVIRRAAMTYEALSQRDNAIAVLQSAAPDVLGELKRQPDLVDLGEDPRFVALLTKSKSK